MKDIIIARRKALGYTQQQLAERLDISDKVVSKWETGRSLPDTSMLTDLAEVLEISVAELLRSDDVSKKAVKDAFVTESNVRYKNMLIITMALQVIAAVLLTVGRVTLGTAQYDYDTARTVFFVLTLFAVLIEIGAITFFLVMRNNLLNKYPTSTAMDKKSVKRLLLGTYPLALAVMLVYVIFHGLVLFEQIIVGLIAGVLLLIPFAVLLLWNKKRK